MTAVILAAGYATRLYPLTENFPKPLLEVGGKSITDRLIDDLEGIAGRFVVISNHKFFPIFEAWAEGRDSITVLDDGTVSNETRLGAVKDIRFAIEKLELKDDLFVMAGDNVLDFTLKDFAEYAINAGTSAVMCHEENRPEALRKTAITGLRTRRSSLKHWSPDADMTRREALPPGFLPVYRCTPGR